MSFRKCAHAKTLIFVDGPQMALFETGGLPVAAVAIPDPDPSRLVFLGSVLGPQEWQGYMDGRTDLRDLFTKDGADLALIDMATQTNGTYAMDAVKGPPDEAWLPLAGIGPDLHTEG